MIHFFWYNKNNPVIPPIIHLCMKSYVLHGNQPWLWTYQKLKNIPEGVIIKDANQVVPKDKVFLYTKDGKEDYAPFSDYFRYKAVYQNGGCWVDTDSILLKSFPFPDLNEKIKIIVSKEEDKSINNAFFYAEKGNSHLKKIIEICEKKIDNNKLRSRFTIGPRLFTSYFLRNRYSVNLDNVLIGNIDMHHPYHWNESGKTWTSKCPDTLKEYLLKIKESNVTHAYFHANYKDIYKSYPYSIYFNIFEMIEKDIKPTYNNIKKYLVLKKLIYKEKVLHQKSFI